MTLYNTDKDDAADSIDVIAVLFFSISNY